MKAIYSLVLTAGVAVLSASASAQISGFNNGAGYSNNNADGPAATFSGNSVTLTYGNSGNTHNSAFNLTPQNTSSFSASFDYLANGGADGAAFVIQNAGPNAVTNNDGGSGLGYEGMGSSVAVVFNIYGGHTIGTNVWTDGNFADYIGTNSANFSMEGDTIAADITYSGGVLNETLTDMTLDGTFSHSYSVDIPGTVGGSTAYFGFTGGDGGGSSTQTISNFTVTPEPSTYAVFGIGALGLILKRRKK